MKSNTKISKIKIITTFLALVFLAVSCGGGGTAPRQQVELTVWKTFEDSQNLRELFEAYRQIRPEVSIVYTKKNIENYEEDLLEALASGTGPDIFSIHNSWLPEYLDKIVEAPEELWQFREYKESFVDVVVEDFTLDNKIYGAALSVDSLGLFYNKDLLGTSGIATPAKTWSELENDVQKIKRSDNQGYFSRSGVAMGTNENVNRAVDMLYLFMLQKGVVPYNSYGYPSFGDRVLKNGNYTNPGEEALSFYTSFASPLSNNYNWNLRSDYSIDAFSNGRAAYLFNYSYTGPTIRQKSPNLNFDIAPVPQPNLEDPTVNFASYWGEVVSKQSENFDYAWDFLKFITSQEALDIYYAQNKQPSSRKDLIELQIQDPEIGVFAHANLTAKSFPRVDQNKIDNIFGQMIDNVILNGFSIEEALRQAQQQVSTLVRE